MATDESAIRTDILALKEDRLARVAMMDSMKEEVQPLRNYFVYAEDVDDDGIMELPDLIPVKPVSATWNQDEQYLIRWQSVDLYGVQTDKLHSFHNFAVQLHCVAIFNFDCAIFANLVHHSSNYLTNLGVMVC